MPAFRYEAVDGAGRPRRGLVEAATARAVRDAVGAESDQLGLVLSSLADYLEAAQVTRQKFATALIYPAVVTVVALAVIAALLFYVVPQIVAVYQQSRTTLPWLTRALIASSDFMRATGWYWAGLLAVGGVTLALLLRRERWRERAQALLLRTPIIGRVLSGRSGARLRAPPRMCAKASRWHARWRASAYSRHCSCTWSPTASRAGNCPRCWNAPRVNRAPTSNAASPGWPRWCSRF